MPDDLHGVIQAVTGYASMALAPPGRGHGPPPLAAFERLGWSAAARSLWSGTRWTASVAQAWETGRERQAAAEVPGLIARLREAAGDAVS